MRISPTNLPWRSTKSALLPGALFCWLLLSATLLTAETSPPYTVRHWGSEDGLPVGPGSAVLQTRDGYLWFGTEEGLGRFNGSECIIFDPFNTPEMRGNTVSYLFEDDQNNLWICNGRKGLLRFRNGGFTYFGTESGLLNEAVSAITEDLNGTLWVGTDGGGLYQMKNDKFLPFTINDSSTNLFINSLACTPDGTVWVAVSEGLFRIRGDERVFFDVQDLHGRSVVTLHVDARGRLWLGGNDLFGRILDGRPVAEPFDESWERIDIIASGPNGVLWFATPNGLIRNAPDGFKRFGTDEGLAGLVFTDLIVDRENSAWVSTGSSGFDQVKPSRFKVIGTRQGLSHPAVTSIMEDSKGAMWIGTEDGLNRWMDGEMTVFGTDQGLSFNLIFNLAEGLDGELWVGTWKGLNKFENGVFTQHPVVDGQPDNSIWSSYRDSDRTIWFGTAKGLVEYRDGEFKTWNHDNSGLSHDDVRCMLRDRQGRFWVGTSWGLNQLVDGRFINYFEASEDEPFNVVLTLHEDPDGGIWIGTQGDGLFAFRDGTFTRFSTAQGLFDNMVFKILEDDSNNLWLTSNRGLFRVSRNQLNSVARGELDKVTGRVFGKRDGLPSSEFNGTIEPNGWKTRDGQLWFASLDGAVVVDPERMFTNGVPPTVGIESIEMDGRRASIQSNTVVIPPGTERVRFDYSVLSYVSPDALMSRCRLDGFDRAWTTNTARHEAQYTGLKPGEYQFQVFAANGDGVWSETMKSVAVIVRPFYWQTGWFQFGTGVFALAVFVWLIRAWTIRSHRLALEALERKHELERERTRISGDLHDDVGSNLGSIALLSRSLRRRVSDDVAEDVGEISRLAQETSDAMRDIVWFINPNEDTVEKMSLRMKDTAAVLLGGGKFVFETADLSADTRLSPQFKRHFFLIFKESLHNVSKHANATRVVIRLTVRSGKLILEVEDDGCGLRDPENNRGNGLASMRRRAADQRWMFNISNRPEGGTLVRLEAPLV